MSTVRIIAGELKGKQLHFRNKSFSDAEITPQKVKGAFFSAIGENLHGSVFLDLFAGSGQMGFEALSRGAEHVFINEPDRMRFDFIRKTLDDVAMLARVTLMHLSWKQALRLMKKHESVCDVVFCDPPYEKRKGAVDIHELLLAMLQENEVLKKDAVVVLQHFHENKPPHNCGDLYLHQSRIYGTTALSYYRAGKP